MGPERSPDRDEHERATRDDEFEQGDEERVDPVDEQGMESFPASDPPEH